MDAASRSKGQTGKRQWLGYCFDRGHWGKGYATEAAAAMLKFGFEAMGLHRIYSTADERNVGGETFSVTNMNQPLEYTREPPPPRRVPWRLIIISLLVTLTFPVGFMF